LGNSRKRNIEKVEELINAVSLTILNFWIRRSKTMLCNLRLSCAEITVVFINFDIDYKHSMQPTQLVIKFVKL